MKEEKRFGQLSTDDDFTKALFPGKTLAELERMCPWWKDISTFTPLFVHYSPLVRDESPEAVAKAKAQWAKSVEMEIPGFAISPFPHMFMIRIPKGEGSPPASEGYWEAVGGIPSGVAQDRSKWDNFTFIRRFGFDCSDYGEGWSYATVAHRIAPDEEPHLWDMPNPRLYWPNGTLAYMPRNDRLAVGPWLKTLFKRVLVDLWDDVTVSNKRTDTLRAFLHHHLSRGPAPKSFIEYVEGLVEVQPAEFDDFLVKKLRAWVEDALAAAKAEAKSMVDTPAPKPRTLAARLDAVPGARGALDDMLRVEGFTDDGGKFVWTKRSGRATILAIWDAVAEHFRLEGFGMNDAALSEALREYLPGLTIQKRVSKLKDSHLYRAQLAASKRALKQGG